jgi:hypothetical protein
MDQIKIECPACEWEPDGHPHWNCTCGHAWNTFDTGGICPKCKERWKDTQCPACSQWSPHIDWYKGLDEAIKQQIREALEKEVYVLR